MGFKVGDKVEYTRPPFEGLQGVVIEEANEYGIVLVMVTQTVDRVTIVDTSVGALLKLRSDDLGLVEVPFEDIVKGMRIRVTTSNKGFKQIRESATYRNDGRSWYDVEGYHLIMKDSYDSLEILESPVAFNAASFEVGDVIEYTESKGQGVTRTWRAMKGRGTYGWLVVGINEHITVSDTCTDGDINYQIANAESYKVLIGKEAND